MLALLALLPVIPTALLLRERIVFLERDQSEAVAALQESSIDEKWVEARVRQIYQSALIRSIQRLESQASDEADSREFLQRSLQQIFGEGSRVEVIAGEAPPPALANAVVAPVDVPSLRGWVRVSGLTGDRLPDGLRGAPAEIWRLPIVLFLTTLAMAAACGWVLLRRLRLEDLRSDLLSTFSHEIRTPLAGLRVVADTLETLPEDEREKRREYHRLLRQENARLLRFVDNFLTINRLERGENPLAKRPIQLGELIDEAAEMMRPLAEAAGAEIRVNPPKSAESEIVASPDALATVLTNLIDNALNHGAKPAKIQVSSVLEPDCAKIVVEDNGPGIPPEERRNVFRRFYQIDQRLSRRSEGCGLGLHICRSLIRAHRGKLEIGESELGGAKITVTLAR